LKRAARRAASAKSSGRVDGPQQRTGSVLIYRSISMKGGRDAWLLRRLLQRRRRRLLLS
jgi:hypothetical protein